MQAILCLKIATHSSSLLVNLNQIQAESNEKVKTFMTLGFRTIHPLFLGKESMCEVTLRTIICARPGLITMACTFLHALYMSYFKIQVFYFEYSYICILCFLKPGYCGTILNVTISRRLKIDVTIININELPWHG
jgi:hypothetical protein